MPAQSMVVVAGRSMAPTLVVLLMAWMLHSTACRVIGTGPCWCGWWVNMSAHCWVLREHASVSFEAERHVGLSAVIPHGLAHACVGLV